MAAGISRHEPADCRDPQVIRLGEQRESGAMQVSSQEKYGTVQQRNRAAGMVAAGLRLFCALLVFGVVVQPSTAAAAVDVKFQHQLANFTSVPGFQSVNLSADEEHKEVFVTDLTSGDVRIFNQYGMEEYRFGKEEGLPAPLDTVVTEDGDIYLLAGAEAGTKILHCNFRGEARGELSLQGLPAEFVDFRAGRLVYSQGLFYLCDLSRMKVVMVDRQGRFRSGVDLLAAVRSEFPDLPPARFGNLEAGGFGVDAKGKILFTISELFAAFVVAPDGTARAFGRKGSVPGRFAVVKGIAADDRGFIYVADILRSVVLVFDPSLQFVTEFGGRGFSPGSLVGPSQLAVCGNMLYVSQLRSRGVSAFLLRYD